MRWTGLLLLLFACTLLLGCGGDDGKAGANRDKDRPKADRVEEKKKG